MVDYIIAPHLCMSLCEYSKVHLALKIMIKFNVETDKIPDSMIEFKFHLNEFNKLDSKMNKNGHSLLNDCQIHTHDVRDSDSTNNVHLPNEFSLYNRKFKLCQILDIESNQECYRKMNLVLSSNRDISYIYNEFVNMYNVMFNVYSIFVAI